MYQPDLVMVSGIGAEALSSGVIPNKRTSHFLTLLILEPLESMAKLVEGVVLTYLAATQRTTTIHVETYQTKGVRSRLGWSRLG